jgi:hypothetical protein
MLTFDAAEVLTHVAPYVSNELVSRGAWDRALVAARSLPDIVSWTCLECRLDSDDERVDLTACISSDVDRAKLFSAVLGRMAPAWRRVASFFEEWKSASSPLREVPFVWLEYDLDGNRVEPFLVAYLLAANQRSTLRGNVSRQPRDVETVVERTVHLLSDRDMSECQRLARRCIEVLPIGGYAAYAAALTSRGIDAARLVVAIPRRDLDNYLTRIGWPGDVGHLKQVLAAAGAERDSLWIDLDVGHTVLPRLAIQCYAAAHHDPWWRELFDRLVALGACTAAKRDALLKWSGSSSFVRRGYAWPTRVDRHMTAKLVYTPGSAVQAKAYLDVVCNLDWA